MSTPKIKMLIPRGKDGLSAYEIALKNGFEGSEDEWLDSLVGENGHSVEVCSYKIHKVYSKEDLDNLCASVADKTELIIHTCGETIDLGWMILYPGNVYSCIIENGAVDTTRKLNDHDIETREDTLLQFTFANDLGIEKEEFVPIFSGTGGDSSANLPERYALEKIYTVYAATEISAVCAKNEGTFYMMWLGPENSSIGGFSLTKGGVYKTISESDVIPESMEQIMLFSDYTPANPYLLISKNSNDEDVYQLMSNVNINPYDVACGNGYNGTMEEWYSLLNNQISHEYYYSVSSLDELKSVVSGKSGSVYVVNVGEDITYVSPFMTSVSLFKNQLYAVSCMGGTIMSAVSQGSLDDTEGLLSVFTIKTGTNLAEKKIAIPTGGKGLSAYEIAVKNGYEGTEEEWIAKVSNPISHEVLYSVETQEDLDSLISGITTGDITFAVTGEVEVAIEDPKIYFEPGFAGTLVYTDGVLTDWKAYGTISTSSSMFTVYDENSSEKKIFVMNGKNGKDGVSPTVKLEENANGTGYILTAQNDGEEEPTEVPIFHGKTPSLSIGTVTTLAAGKSATASITGTAENPVLNLGIPKGAKGADGEDGVDGGSETFEMIGTYDISGGIIDVSFASLKKIAVYFSIPAGYSASTMSMLVYMSTNYEVDPVLCHGHAVATYKKPIGGRIDIEGRPWYSVKSVIAVGDTNTADSTDPYSIATSQFAETIAPYHINTPIQRLKLAMTGGTLPSGSTVILCGVKA